MARQRCKSNVGFLPPVTYFKPAGLKMSQIEEVVLNHDEFEALRLKDLHRITQGEAAKQMNISQPTFHRILTSAREKMAHALVNGKALKIEGGNVTIEERYVPPCRWRHICRHGWKDKATIPSGDSLSMIKGEDMKIAITSVDGTLEGMVDERFGRSRKIIVYDVEDKSHAVVDNTQNLNASQGAGIQSAQNIINVGAKTVISGHLGPNAFRVLQTAGIDVYTVTDTSVAQAIHAFEQGKLAKLTGPDVEGHW